MEKSLDELAILKWKENYKFRLFMDLMNHGAQLYNSKKLDFYTKRTQSALLKNINKLYRDLSQIKDKHRMLIDQLDSENYIDAKPLAIYSSELLRVIRILEDYSIETKSSGGRSIIKGFSSIYLHKLLSDHKHSELNWLKSFMKSEVSNKKFIKNIFSKLPKNVTLPSINEDKHSPSYWYKSLKDQVKKTEKEYSNIENFKQGKSVYLMILKDQEISHPKNLQDLICN